MSVNSLGKPDFPLAMLLSDSMVLLHLLRGQRGKLGENGHAERLQRFYAPQASRYDDFRDRLLHGREELVARLAPPPGSTVVELGGGTGRNIEFLGARMLSLERVEIVDVCPALLSQAGERCARWPEVARAVQADAATYVPERPADCVFFSYSLTMMPDWRAALANALRMLRPGGLLGVVDFYVSGPAPATGHVRHHPLERWFWQKWFAHDGVHLSVEHLDALEQCTDPVHRGEHKGDIPWLPALKAPYYVFVGRKPA